MFCKATRHPTWRIRIKIVKIVKISSRNMDLSKHKSHQAATPSFEVHNNFQKYTTTSKNNQNRMIVREHRWRGVRSLCALALDPRNIIKSGRSVQVKNLQVKPQGS